MLLSGCSSLFFYPRSELALDPGHFGIEFRDVWISVEEGTRIHGWWLPARETEPFSGAECTVLHLHGNGGNVASHFPAIGWLPGVGVNVLTIDYRGYGRSDGSPTLPGVHEDAKAAIRYITSTPPPFPGLDPHRIVLFGQSLGGAIALETMRSSDGALIRGVAVEGAFSSYADVVGDRLSAFVLTSPFAGLLKQGVNDRFSPKEAIVELDGRPVLIIHSREDRVVDPYHSEILFERAAMPKTLWKTTGPHGSAMLQREGRHRVLEWIEAVCEPETQASARA